MNCKILIVIISFFLIEITNPQERIAMKNDVKNKFNTYFVKSNINLLGDIINFYEDNFFTYTQKLENKDSIRMVKLHSLKECNSSDSFFKKIKIDKDLTDSLFQQIDKSTYNEIWQYDSGTQKININTHGEYTNFLKSLSNSNVLIKQYYERLITAGGISPSMIALVKQNYSELDLNDENIRLFLAVHYLTINQW